VYVYICIRTYVRATGGASGVGYVDKSLHICSPRVIRSPANGHMRPQTALAVHPSCGHAAAAAATAAAAVTEPGMVRAK